LFTYIFAKLFVHGVKYFGIINLILNKQAVPERLQHQANADELLIQMKKYIDDPVYRESVRDDLKKVRPYLGDKGATLRVAKALEKYLKDKD
jgi:lipid-A-disaccharide synthase